MKIKKVQNCQLIALRILYLVGNLKITLHFWW